MPTDLCGRGGTRRSERVLVIGSMSRCLYLLFCRFLPGTKVEQHVDGIVQKAQIVQTYHAQMTLRRRRLNHLHEDLQQVLGMLSEAHNGLVFDRRRQIVEYEAG